MSERKVNNLATTSAQNYAAMEITSKSDKWMIDFGIECAKNEALRNEIAALTAERDERAEQVRRYDKAIGVLTEENAALKAKVVEWTETASAYFKELHALTAENARLKAALENPSGLTHCCFCGTHNLDDPKGYAGERACHACGHGGDGEGPLPHMASDAWNNRRASIPTDANTSWFCVPCGFTTSDAAEAQAHLGPHMIELTCPFDGQIWRFHTQAQADMLQKHLDWHAAQLLTPTPEAR